jgi:short-subunit dehydrogenase
MAFPTPKPDTTCIVTGASSGIGSELARGLARRGYNLTLVARREDRLRALAEELHSTAGVVAAPLACDLSDADMRSELVMQVESRGREVAVLVNSAGLGTGGLFANLDREAELRMVRVNIEAVVDLCGVYGAAMARRGSGAILNVASIAGFAPIPRQATYAATKAFVINFSHALHAEMGHAGVTVTTLCPGPTDTEFGKASGPQVQQVMQGLPGFMVSRADRVAEAGLRAMIGGQRQLTVGAINKINATSAYLTPRKLELAVMDRVYPVHE